MRMFLTFTPLSALPYLQTVVADSAKSNSPLQGVREVEDNG